MSFEEDDSVEPIYPVLKGEKINHRGNLQKFAVALLQALGSTDQRTRVLNGHLGVGIDQQTTVQGAYPVYMRMQGFWVFHKIMQMPWCKVRKVVNFDSDGVQVAPKYGRVEIKPDEYETLWQTGYALLTVKHGKGKKAKQVPVVLRLHESRHDDNLQYEMTCPKRYATVLRNLHTSMHFFEYSESLYRGKTIEAHARSEVKFLPVQPVDWADMVVPDEIRKEIEMQVINVINDSAYHHRHGLPWRRGVLLDGRPGTGKTMIGKVLAGKINATFMVVSAKSIYDQHDIRHIFDAARRFAPTLIFFEDIDLFGYSRDMGRNSVLGEMLTQMDGVKDSEGIFIVASTNDKTALDRALVNRPNRFDTILHFDEPSKADREKILRLYSAKYGCDFDDGAITAAAYDAEHFTPAFLNELVVHAKMMAIHDNAVNGSVPGMYLAHSLKKIKKMVELQKEVYH